MTHIIVRPILLMGGICYYFTSFLGGDPSFRESLWNDTRIRCNITELSIMFIIIVYQEAVVDP